MPRISLVTNLLLPLMLVCLIPLDGAHAGHELHSEIQISQNTLMLCQTGHYYRSPTVVPITNTSYNGISIWRIIQNHRWHGRRLACKYADNYVPPTATADTNSTTTLQNRNKENTKTRVSSVDSSSEAKFNFKWASRSAWQAAPPLHTPTLISIPDGVSHVIIHHTATPAGACRRNQNACAATVRAIQRNHQQQRHWNDIGYNFLIGGSDERAEIYEGRGFDVVGAHAVGYNSRSVGIALIGDWTADLPPRPVLDKLHQLITYGTQLGHIQRNYVLLGHRQVKTTDCPGNRLYNALKEWPHYEQHAA